MASDAPELTVNDRPALAASGMVSLTCPWTGCLGTFARDHVAVLQRPGEHVGCPHCGRPCRYPTLTVTTHVEVTANGT